MKHFTYKVFLIFAIFVVYQPLFSQDRTIIMGTATIKNICKDGKVSGEGGKCVFEVKFYPQDNLTLDQAKAKAAEFGLSLATPEELTEAYTYLKLNQHSYGLLANGQMAVPIQADISTFKKGPNIGITGGNQGFFYTMKPGTPIVAPPKPITTTNSGSNVIKLSGDAGTPVAIDQSKDGYYNREFFKLNGINYSDSQAAVYDAYKKKYANGVGNIMQDKWDDANYQHILNRSLDQYINEKFPNRYKNNTTHLKSYLKYLITNKDNTCKSCKLTRYEFVGFFVPEYLKTLRTGANPVLSKQFSEYVSFHLAKANRYTLESWKYYSRSTTAELNDTPFIPGLRFNDGPTLIDREDIEPIVYDDTGRGRFIKSGIPLGDKTVNEFKSKGMHGSPMYFTHKQNMTILDFSMPLVAQSFPDDPEVSELLSVPNYLSKNLSAEAQALNIVSSHAQKAGISFATGAAVLFSAQALNAFSVALTAATNISGATINGVVMTYTIQSASLGSKAIGPALSSAIGPVAVGVSVFMVGFMPTGGKAIEIAIFENSLKEGCYIKPRNENWQTMSDQEKIENFTFLFKMLVLDANDFTYLIPDHTASISEQRKLETEAANMVNNAQLKSQILASMDTRYNTPNMYYYREANLTLEQAINKANFNRWQLAKEDEVREAWISGFDAYAFLRMADGRFAVPVQSDHSNFKRGANIDAKGGNQGFLYTVNRKDYKRIQSRFKKHLYIASQNNSPLEVIKSNEDEQLWKVIPAGNGWVRIQNLKNPELYLNFSGHKLEIVKILPNWASALWKFQPGYGEYIRIQNNWYPDKYIHNENGKLEVGPITDNMWSAMWKFE